MNTICWRRAWEILQEMRWVLKDIAGVEVASPGRETTDLEGRIVKDRVRNIQERQTALTDSARAIRGYRKLANQPLTLRGSSIGADLFGIVENLLMLAEELIVMWANDDVRFPQFSRVVWVPEERRDRTISIEELQRLEGKGAVGNICLRFYNVDGQQIEARFTAGCWASRRFEQ